MITDDDFALLEAAASAAKIPLWPGDARRRNGLLHRIGTCLWNPITFDSDRMGLIRDMKMCIDYEDCTVWKRLPNHDLVQEFWGGECGDEAHAILRAAAEIGRRTC